MQPAWIQVGENAFQPVLMRCVLENTAVVDHPQASHISPSPDVQLLNKRQLFVYPEQLRWREVEQDSLAVARGIGRKRRLRMNRFSPNAPL